MSLFRSFWLCCSDVGSVKVAPEYFDSGPIDTDNKLVPKLITDESDLKTLSNALTVDAVCLLFDIGFIPVVGITSSSSLIYDPCQQYTITISNSSSIISSPSDTEASRFHRIACIACIRHYWFKIRDAAPSPISALHTSSSASPSPSPLVSTQTVEWDAWLGWRQLVDLWRHYPRFPSEDGIVIPLPGLLLALVSSYHQSVYMCVYIYAA